MNKRLRQKVRAKLEEFIRQGKKPCKGYRRVWLRREDADWLTLEMGSKKNAKRCVAKLDNWFREKGLQKWVGYTSHRRCIQNWVLREVRKELRIEVRETGQGLQARRIVRHQPRHNRLEKHMLQLAKENEKRNHQHRLVEKLKVS